MKSRSFANNDSSIALLRRDGFSFFFFFWLNGKSESEEQRVWCGQWSGIAERKRPVTPNGKTAANGKEILKAGICSAGRYTECASG